MGGFFSSYIECDGTGQCLEAIKHNKYRISRQFFCVYDCEPIRCVNYIVCKNIVPECSTADEVCKYCIDVFRNRSTGKLQCRQIEECGICYTENRLGVCNPNCMHFICIDCFKKCYCGLMDCYIKGAPKFPFSRDIYIAYQADPDKEEWDYSPEIMEWRELYEDWKSNKTNAEKLARCPFCRK